MDEKYLEMYWTEIPIGKENSISYLTLGINWRASKRKVRHILHELSGYDNGDDYILIRSSKGNGFYRTDDPEDIAAYRAECISRGKRTFIPIRKIDRVLHEDTQLSFENNLKSARLANGLKQTEVCERMHCIDPSFDPAMLSKMESGRCLPIPIQLAQLASIYGCAATDLVRMELYQ